MSDLQAHQMKLNRTFSTGAEEWSCPTCGRRLVMQWTPRYKKIVLEAGEEHVAHTGGKGGLAMGKVQVQPLEESAQPEENMRLDLWQNWINSDDAAKWWPEDY